MDVVKKSTIAVASQNMSVNTGTTIDLYWSVSKANTWYCPSKGLIGATRGTWEISRALNWIRLNDGKEQIASLTTLDLEYRWLGYPFDESMRFKGGRATFFKKSATFYVYQYTDYGLAQMPICDWAFVHC